MCNNNCDKGILEEREPISVCVDGHLEETTDDVVVVPRGTYDELIAESTILRVVEKMIDSDSFTYDSDRLTAIRIVLEIGGDAQDDKGEEA